MQRTILSGLLCAMGLTGAAQASLLTNGNFEAGNTGFSSDYQYTSANVSPYVQQYGVTTSSFAWSNFWNNVAADHTSGAGKFLIADGGPNTNAAIWRQTVAVSANTAMTLTGWLATWTSFPGTTVRVEVNGQTVANWVAPVNGTWTQYSAGWNSGSSTSATIALYASVYFQPGADVAIDDLVLVPGPGAASLLGVFGLLAARRRR